MRFSKEINQFLEGKAFSNALTINFSPEKYLLRTRINMLSGIVKDKNIIHLGCADHLDLIDDKMKKGKWLHGILVQNSNRCIGIDINSEAISYLKEHYNIPDLHCVNIETEANIETITGKGKWDYLLLGEIIEHMNNPVAFLKNLHEKFSNSTEKIIITAPNVYNIMNAKRIRKNLEVINTDHRYWFSPYTLTKIIMESGFSDCELSFVEHVKLPILTEIRKHIHRILKKPLYLHAKCYSTLVITAKF
jgi:hypothetical protein